MPNHDFLLWAFTAWGTALIAAALVALLAVWRRRVEVPSPPCDTIADIVRERRMPAREFAAQLGCSEARALDLLTGMVPITPPVAVQLAAVLGSTPESWLQRQALYDAKTRI